MVIREPLVKYSHNAAAKMIVCSCFVHWSFHLQYWSLGILSTGYRVKLSRNKLKQRYVVELREWLTETGCECLAAIIEYPTNGVDQGIHYIVVKLGATANISKAYIGRRE